MSGLASASFSLASGSCTMAMKDVAPDSLAIILAHRKKPSQIRGCVQTFFAAIPQRQHTDGPRRMEEYTVITLTSRERETCCGGDKLLALLLLCTVLGQSPILGNKPNTIHR